MRGKGSAGSRKPRTGDTSHYYSTLAHLYPSLSPDTCRKLSEPQLQAYWQNADDVRQRNAQFILSEVVKAFSQK